MNILKSIGAILAGMIVGALLATGTDALVVSAGLAPPVDADSANNWPAPMLGLALMYRTLYNVFSGYVTAWLAPNRPMRLVQILAVIGFLATAAGAIVMREKGQLWYPILLAVFTFPSVWLGGWLRTGRKSVN